MAFVQKAIARLHEPEKLDQLLKELGRKHHTYKAKAKYVDLCEECGILEDVEHFLMECRKYETARGLFPTLQNLDTSAAYLWRSGDKDTYNELLVGPQFIQAIQPSLDTEWTEEVSVAWKLLFAHIGYIMKGAMAEAAEEEAAKGRA